MMYEFSGSAVKNCHTLRSLIFLGGALVILTANAGDARDVGLITGLGRSPGGENGNPLQNSWLENSKDREACQALVHGVTKSQT